MDLVYLDVWARSLAELDKYEDAIAFLDWFQFPTYGKAQNPRYRTSGSKTILPEGNNVWHGTYIYEVRYSSARILKPIGG
jgi:hypothetical protein